MKDKRYAAVKALIENGTYKTLQDITNIVPKSIVARDLEADYYRFLKALAAPQLFTIKDLVTLSGLIEIDVQVLFKMVLRDMEKSKRKK